MPLGCRGTHMSMGWKSGDLSCCPLARTTFPFDAAQAPTSPDSAWARWGASSAEEGDKATAGSFNESRFQKCVGNPVRRAGGKRAAQGPAIASRVMV